MKSATARHLLVDSEELCLDLKNRIANGEKFEDLAKEYSSCPSGHNGENSQDIIKEALNLKEFSFKGIKSDADSLLEKYGSKDIELIKLLLMQQIS